MTLPREIYDRLKTAADLFGGVGSGALADKNGNPCCLLGLAAYCDGLELPRTQDISELQREKKSYRVTYDKEQADTPVLAAVTALGDWRQFDDTATFAKRHIAYDLGTDRLTDFDAFMKYLGVEVVG